MHLRPASIDPAEDEKENRQQAQQNWVRALRPDLHDSGAKSDYDAQRKSAVCPSTSVPAPHHTGSSSQRMQSTALMVSLNQRARPPNQRNATPRATPAQAKTEHHRRSARTDARNAMKRISQLPRKPDNTIPRNQRLHQPLFRQDCWAKPQNILKTCEHRNARSMQIPPPFLSTKSRSIRLDDSIPQAHRGFNPQET